MHVSQFILYQEWCPTKILQWNKYNHFMPRCNACDEFNVPGMIFLFSFVSIFRVFAKSGRSVFSKKWFKESDIIQERRDMRNTIERLRWKAIQQQRTSSSI